MSKTRTERRLEKRQAIILLVLVLVVSLATFVLGVMVGRRGSERDFARQLAEQQETVRIVQAPVVAPVPAPVAAPGTEELPARKDPLIDAVVESARLSFYDDLARDSVPLGSGINQAPSIPESGSAGSRPPLDLADRPIVVRGDTPAALPRVAGVAGSERTAPSSSGAPAGTEAMMPEVVVQGTHVVQVGSFGSATDAASFRQELLDKGYPAFLAEANLGERGIWYRVRIGPYRDSETAAIARKVLLEKEQIEGLVSRHTP